MLGRMMHIRYGVRGLHLRECRVLRQLFRNHSISRSDIPRIAIVGSGPAGFYTAQHILKGHVGVEVDIYEKLPVPFGLVRFGVAPDHPEVKNVINTFTQTARNPRCNFYGNVTVGRDVSLSQLRNAYTAVILAYGADDDRTLGIPGEDLSGVCSARAFVGWYNGLPEHRELDIDLTQTDTAVVFGQGNVAIDVARILLTPTDILSKTDITEYAMETLIKSRVNKVILVGRRGPLQVAFTTAELREMVKLPECMPRLNSGDFERIQNIKELPRPRRRLTELMVKTALNPPPPEGGTASKRVWELKFLRSPKEFLPDSSGDRLAGVNLVVNKLQGASLEKQWAEPTDERETIKCGLAFRSIGYRSKVLESDQLFNSADAVIPNEKGRIASQPGMYCSGWVKRGPIGVIVSTMNDGFETGKAVIDDIKTGSLAVQPYHHGYLTIKQILQEKGKRTVTFDEWDKIDTYEVREGERKGKPREKIVHTEKFLEVAHS